MQITLTCLNVKTGGMTAFETRKHGQSLTEWPGSQCPANTVADGVFGMINSARIIQFGFSCAMTKPAFLLSKIVIPRSKLDKGKLVAKGPDLVQQAPSGKLSKLITKTETDTGLVQKLPSDVVTAPKTEQYDTTAGAAVLRPDSKVRLGDMIDTGAAAPDPPPPAPQPQPASQQYAPPMSKNGLRLYACQSLDGKVCEQPVADMFCQQQEFVRADAFKTGKTKDPTETIAGEACTKKTCRVFNTIVCVR
jgi:hypothetical protein